MKENLPSAAERYDDALRWAHLRHHKRLPSNYPVPQPTSAWPEENVALLEQYQDWLWSSGTSRYVIEHVYIPIAGYALGLNLKPHSPTRPQSRPGKGTALHRGQAIEHTVDQDVS